MSSKMVSYDKRLAQAVRCFWRGRSAAAEKQLQAGRRDQGNRGAVTGGKNLDSFRDMIFDVVRRHGPRDCVVHSRKSLVVLPGFFRPTKQWDILIACGNRLLASMELKSLCGPSFGKNANNRCEEAIGSGCDFRKAQSEGLFGRGASPFLGYFLLIEDAEASRAPVGVKSPHFPTDPVFQSSSYQTRMKILCERLVEQQLYSCAAVLVAVNSATSGASKDLSLHTSFRFLLAKLAGHLASEAGHPEGSTGRIKEEPYGPEDGSLLSGEWFSSSEPADA